MDGILNINKHSGPTSHDLVHDIRRIFGQKKVGHAGTLDPMATGVLVVCLGKATRVVEYLVGCEKGYRARLVLGRTTDTQDSTGNAITEQDASHITQSAFQDAITEFVGEIEQVPPMVSAIKFQGKPLYKLAREGKTINRSPRNIIIHSIEMVSFQPGQYPEAEILVECSSGTYIRTLCADIGDKLGCGANMSMLERTKVGSFNLDDSITMDQLNAARAEDRLESLVLGIDNALCDMPMTSVDEIGRRKVIQGISIKGNTSLEDKSPVRIIDHNGKLIAIGIAVVNDNETIVKPHKVFIGMDD